jgi:ABC-type transport system involved in multi-copper enzyme maturation permease subunit
MTHSILAEVRRLRRWPALWVLCGTWVVLNLSFGYLFPYLTYRNSASGKALLDQIVPTAAPITLVQGMPMFGGALLMILGALTVGSGYGWGTWKTVFTTGPRRTTALGGTFITVALVVAVLVTITLGVDLGASFVVAAATGQPATWPSLTLLAQGYGSALLIGLMWTTAGLLLGTLARGPALAVGLGLVWSLVVENLLRGVATLLGPLKTVTDVLPGTAAGSLAGALGAAPQSDPNGTPGVTTILGGTTATVLLIGYLAVFVIASLGLTARRDVSG